MALLLHVLMLVLLSGGSAKVVKDFERECGQFFAARKSPTKLSGPQYKQICQTLNGVPYYATYYDTDKKIPVYSAYRFRGLKRCKRKDNWYIEPQLDDTKAVSNIASEGSVDINRGDHQALNEDYKSANKYDKGHLAPVYQAESQSCADATFTLTNAAPQDYSFNRGQWKRLERQMATELLEQCLKRKYSVFIVTGVVPGKKTLKNRVKVPSHFWTAYCCLDKNNKCQISGGFFGKNKNILPGNKTVKQLETELAKHYKVSSFEVFYQSLYPAKKPKIEKIKP